LDHLPITDQGYFKPIKFIKKSQKTYGIVAEGYQQQVGVDGVSVAILLLIS
jgi:hypothetical protein